VVESYIDDLLRHEAYDTAAQLSPRLLKDNVDLWERWVFLFAQTRQLPKLAPYIPTGEQAGRCIVDRGLRGHMLWDIITAL
jgi:hypothetical protein